MTRRPEGVWFALLIVGTAFEMWALRGKRREATLSHFTRKAFRTNTPAGRAAFVLSWAALTAWLVPHIASEENNRA